MKEKGSKGLGIIPTIVSSFQSQGNLQHEIRQCDDAIWRHIDKMNVYSNIISAENNSLVAFLLCIWHPSKQKFIRLLFVTAIVTSILVPCKQKHSCIGQRSYFMLCPVSTRMVGHLHWAYHFSTSIYIRHFQHN